MNYCTERFLRVSELSKDLWYLTANRDFWTTDRYSYQKQIPEIYILFVNTKNKRGVKCPGMQNLSTNTPWKHKMISYPYSELKRQVHSLYLNV